MFIIDLIVAIFSFGMSLIGLVVKLIVALIVGVVAHTKGYSGWIWAGVVLIVPIPVSLIMLFVSFYLPKKYPKLPLEIRNNKAFEGKNPVIASMMALSAMIAKSDGNVTKEEIKYVKQFITGSFGISSNEINDYAGVFEYGKQNPDKYEEFTKVIKKYYVARPDMLLAISYMLVGVANLEGENPAKENITRTILGSLGFTGAGYEQIKAAVTGQGGYGNSYGNNYGNDFGHASKEDCIKKYTEVLGVSENSSLQEIKKAYRKLVKQYHPDKLAADSVPPDYIEFANQKIREINEAYEYLEKVKS